MGATCAFLTLIAGLVGMAKYSSPTGDRKRRRRGPSSSSASPLAVEMERLGSSSGDGGERVEVTVNPEFDADPSEYSVNADNDDYDGELAAMLGKSELKDKASPKFVGRWWNPTNLKLTKRQWGILGAVVNGAWGGMNLIPLHYAKKHHGLSGASYVVSFAGGAMMVNTAMFLLLYLYYIVHERETWTTAFLRLPNWHLREMGGQGLLAGILYSIGNLSSIVAVTYLGQGAGYSACQMQLLVSGLWGVFYFREITSFGTILRWFLSAATALVGILWLAYEREKSSAAPLSPLTDASTTTNDAEGIVR